MCSPALCSHLLHVHKVLTCSTHVLLSLLCAGRWPADQAAYLKTKAALGCQLADAMAASFSLPALASEDGIDVLADGFAFRLFLWSPRCVP